MSRDKDQIDENTRVLFFCMESETYEFGFFKEWTVGKIPICTEKHFVHVMAKLIEEIYPNLGENPLSQDVAWREALKNRVSEIEGTPEVTV